MCVLCSLPVLISPQQHPLVLIREEPGAQLHILLCEPSLCKAEEERGVIPVSQFFTPMFTLELVNYKDVKKKETEPRIRSRQLFETRLIFESGHRKKNMAVQKRLGHRINSLLVSVFTSVTEDLRRSILCIKQNVLTYNNLLTYGVDNWWLQKANFKLLCIHL